MFFLLSSSSIVLCIHFFFVFIPCLLLLTCSCLFVYVWDEDISLTKNNIHFPFCKAFVKWKRRLCFVFFFSFFGKLNSFFYVVFHDWQFYARLSRPKCISETCSLIVIIIVLLLSKCPLWALRVIKNGIGTLLFIQFCLLVGLPFSLLLFLSLLLFCCFYTLFYLITKKERKNLISLFNFSPVIPFFSHLFYYRSRDKHACTHAHAYTR